MAVKIKLKRLGKIRAPYYRIVVADARTKRDGRAIEEIGKYHPKAEPSFIEVNSERAQHWLSVGAQPTDPVRKILEITGDWQKFKGLPGSEGTLRMAAPKEDRKEIFAAAVKETLGDGTAAPKGKSRAKSADVKAGDAKSAGAAAGKAEKSAPKDGSPKAESPKADKPARQAKETQSSGEDKGTKGAEAVKDVKAAEAVKDVKGAEAVKDVKAAEDVKAGKDDKGHQDGKEADAPDSAEPKASAAAESAPQAAAKDAPATDAPAADAAAAASSSGD